MGVFLQDLKYGIRLLAKSPGFAAVALATLTLGIGANVAIFTFVDAALLRPLPFHEPSRLMQVFETRHTDVWSEIEASYPDYRDWRAQQDVFTEIGAFNGPGDVALRTESGPQRVVVARVSDNFFRVLEAQPLLGRDFREGEESASAAPVVLLSHRTWRERYGARTDIVRQAVTINDTAATVVGVLPAQFRFAPLGEPEFWIPLRPQGGGLARRNLHWINVMGRLKPGVSRDQANDAMNVIMHRLAQQYPIAQGVESVNTRPLIEVVVGRVRPILLVLLAGVGLLLLIACANVANLLLARSAARRREMAIRASLGATRGRIVRQLMTEGALLAFAGGLAGLLAARWVVYGMAARLPESIRLSAGFLADVRIDLAVVLFSCGVAALTAVLFALAPAMRIGGTDVQEALKDGTRGSHGKHWTRFSAALVVGELAIAMVLLAGAGLLMKSFYALLKVDPGFEAQNLLLVHVATPRAFKDGQNIAFVREVMSKVSAVPGVREVGTTSVEPLNGGNTIRFRHVDESAREGEEANIRDVTPGFFHTMGARWMSGRDFTETDDKNSPQVLIVNQTFATMFFHGEDPVGKQIVYTFNDKQKPRTIVGLVADVKEAALDDRPRPAIYEPFLQGGDFDVLAVRTSAKPESLMKAVDDAIRSVNAQVMTYDVKTGETLISGSPTAYLHRYPAWLAGAFAVFALALAVVGLYGIVAYSVSQRTREIGIRIALGAQPGTVRSMVLRESLRLTGLGLLVGIVGAAASAQMLRSVLFGISAWDPGMLATIATVCGLVAVAAAYLPAYRASTVDPMVALRYE